jgi:hypothetical protein
LSLKGDPGVNTIGPFAWRRTPVEVPFGLCPLSEAEYLSD